MNGGLLVFGLNFHRKVGGIHVIHSQANIHRLAAHLAIFGVALAASRKVTWDFEVLATVGAWDWAPFQHDGIVSDWRENTIIAPYKNV